MKLSRFVILILLSCTVMACSSNSNEENQDNAENKPLAIDSDKMSGEGLSSDLEKDPADSTMDAADSSATETNGEDASPEDTASMEESEEMTTTDSRDGNENKPDPEKNQDTKKLKNITKIIYRFRDSSVPPPYHRSYRVIVTPEGSNKIVTDYSDELSNTTTELEEGAWDELVQLAQKIQKPGSYEAKGATGTKGNTIQIYNGDEKIYSLYWDSMSTDKIDKPTYAFKSAINATAGKSDPLLKKKGRPQE